MKPTPRKPWPKWRVLAWSMQFSLKAGAISAAESYFVELTAYLMFADTEAPRPDGA